MKIQAIRGENIASLAGPFEVRFDAPPLAQSGLFAITGPTGSGKTSLLDTMCLALFDNTPRLQTGVRVRKARSDFNPQGNISTTDPRNLLTTGAASAFAEVDFFGTDHAGYRARWSVRCARNKPGGRLQVQQMELRDLASDKLISGGRKRDTLFKIEQCLGLNFSQFQRSVLLPQGDFAQFLKADESQRAELLEQITGTEIYSEISRLAHQKSRDWSDKLAAEQARLQLDMPLDEAARQSLEEARDGRKKLLVVEQSKLTQLQKDLTWYEEKNRLAEKIRAVREECRAADAVIASLKPRREKLRLVASVQPLRSGYDQLLSVQDKIRKNKAEQENLAQKSKELSVSLENLTAQADLAAKAHEAARDVLLKAGPDLAKAQQLDDEIERLKSQQKQIDRESRAEKKALSDTENKHDSFDRELKTFRVEQEELNRYFRSNSGFEKTAADWPRVEHLLQRYQETRNQLAELKKQLSDLADQQNLLGDKRAQITKEYEGLRGLLEKEEESLKKLAARGKRYDLKELRKVREKWQAKLEKLKPLLGLLDETEHQQKRRDQLDNQLQQLHGDLENSATELTEGKQQLAHIETARSEAAKALQLTLRAAKEDVKSLRAGLVQGEACPVCGSENHPWAKHSPVIERLQSEQHNRVEELEKQEAQWRQTVAKAQAASDQMQRENHQKQQELEEFGKRRSELENEWERLSGGQLDTSLNDDSARTALMEQLEQTENELESVSEEEKQALIFIEDLRQAEAKAKDLQSQLRKVERKLDEISVQSRAIEADQKAHEREKSRWSKEQPEIRAQLDKYFGQDTLDDDLQGLLKETEKLVDLWRKKNERQQVLKLQIDETGTALELVSVELDRQKAALGLLKSSHEKLDSHYQEVMDSRLTLFGGQPVGVVTEQLQLSDQQSRKTSELANAEAQSAQEQAHKLEALISERRAQLESLESEMLRLEEKNRQGVISSGLKFDQLASLFALDEKWLKSERKVIEGAELSHRASEVRLAEWRDQLHRHAGEGEPEKSDTSLQKELTVQSRLVDNFRSELAEVEVLINQDEAKRTRLKKQNEALLALQGEAAVWQKMKDVIGSENGSKFRNFAQSVTLDSLVQYANAHLHDLARRYEIERAPGSDLEIRIIDNEMGDERRSVYSLSGGESFLVSLALALGLSSLSAVRTPVETLFIDEGFGSLDIRTLDIAIAALDALQSQGRKVGVISHVSAMVERVGVQIKLVAASGGRSRIQVMGA